MLYEGDMEKLKTMYPNTATVIIRKLVRWHIKQVESKLDKLRLTEELEYDQS